MLFSCNTTFCTLPVCSGITHRHEPLGVASSQFVDFNILGVLEMGLCQPGRTLHLLPAASLPEDLHWVSSNPRIAKAIAQWTVAVEKEAQGVVPEAVQLCVHHQLAKWQGELMPISRSWVEEEVKQLANDNYVIAKFALLLAKASYQIDQKLMQEVLSIAGSEEDFIRILAWCSNTASRYVANRISKIAQEVPNNL